jgi:hypothetical protein
VVPTVLQERVMSIFHEGYGLPGAARPLETIRLRYYCREQFTPHCKECLGCQLRNAHTRNPKVLVQMYGDVWEPMSRVHMDDEMTSPLVMTASGILLCKCLRMT